METVPQISFHKYHYFSVVILSVLILLAIGYYGQHYVVTTLRPLVMLLNVDVVTYLIFKLIRFVKLKKTTQNR